MRFFLFSFYRVNKLVLFKKLVSYKVQVYICLIFTSKKLNAFVRLKLY